MRAQTRFPFVVIQGPRRIGKSTLLKYITGAPVFDFDNPETVDLVKRVDRKAIERIYEGAILDGVQRHPEVCRVIRREVIETEDESILAELEDGTMYVIEKDPMPLEKPFPGYFHHRDGWTVRVTVLPMSLEEARADGTSPDDFHELLFRGGYPGARSPSTTPEVWYEDELRALFGELERNHIRPSQIPIFRRLMQLCVQEAGRNLNYARLARMVGVSTSTVRRWIALACRFHIAHFLPAVTETYGQRTTRRPRFYLWDTGLACRLLGITSVDELAGHPDRNAILRTWAVGEIRKYAIARGLEGGIGYFRDRYGHEIPVVIRGKRKAACVFAFDSPRLRSRSLEKWTKLAGRDWFTMRLLTDPREGPGAGVCWYNFPRELTPCFGRLEIPVWESSRFVGLRWGRREPAP
ncbi:MAG: ATP-binding protein [Rhodothermales bacterium]|nr:ATP-binding protein [Rhodothermales bacterium]